MPHPHRSPSRDPMIPPKPPGCLDCLRTKLHLLPIITFTWLAVTVCLSYVLAAINKDTEADFPYISKTANVDPQRAIFSQMVTMGSVLYGICSTMRYLSMKADLLSCSVSRGYHWLNIIGVCTGLLVCLGNTILGNFPTDGYRSHYKAPHYVGATAAFAGGRRVWLDTNKVVMVTGTQTKKNQQDTACVDDMDHYGIAYIWYIKSSL